MTALESHWSPVKHLILGDDPQVRVYADTVLWLKKIVPFRKAEDDRMFLQEPTPEDLTLHKALLQRLITDGEHLLSLIEQVGFPANPEGLTPESLSVSLELLRADYRGWHQPMPAEQREQ